MAEHQRRGDEHAGRPPTLASGAATRLSQAAPALLRQAHRRAREAPPTRGRVSPRRRQRSLGKHPLQSADALHRVHLGRSRARGYYRYTWQARGGLLRPPPRVSVNLVPLRSDETTRTSADSLVPRPAASGPDHRRHNVRWNCLPSRIGVCADMSYVALLLLPCLAAAADSSDSARRPVRIDAYPRLRRAVPPPRLASELVALSEAAASKPGAACPLGHPGHRCRRCRRVRRPIACVSADAQTTAHHTQLGHRTRCPAHRSPTASAD